MGQAPSPALLRLREADIVRLCGLAAAGEGLRLAGQHVLEHPQRQGGRLSAGFDTTSGDTWAEVVEAVPHLALRWGCGCAVGQGTNGAADNSTSDALSDSAVACVHVAALLSAWLRIPADFADAQGEPATEAIVVGKRRIRPTASAAKPDGSPPHHARPAGLRAALEALPARQQEIIARQVLETASTVPANTITDALAVALADPARVGQLLEALDTPALALFRAINLRGGSITTADLNGLAARHRGGPGAVTTARQMLEARGLLFRSPAIPPPFSPEAPSPEPTAALVWFIPAEIARAAGADLPVRPMPTVAAHGPPRFAGDTAHATGSTSRVWIHPAPLRQLCVAAGLLAHADGVLDGAESRPPARRAYPHGAHGAPLPAVPGDPPPAALAAWARATHLPMGLLRLVWRLEHAGNGAAQSAPSLGALARLPAEEWAATLRSAFRGWLERETYAELSDLNMAEDGAEARCDPRHPALRRSALAEESTRARRFIVDVVGHLREGGWYALDDLLDVVWWVHPLFLRERQRVFSGPAWWLMDADGGRPLDARTADEWRRAEGRYVTALLAGPLHWWGVVDLAGAEGTPARAVRLTPLGQYLLGHKPTPPSTVAALASGWGPAALPTRDAPRDASRTAGSDAGHDAGLAVQPLAAPPALLDALGQWARVTGLAGDRLLFRFAPDLACRAFDAGIDPAPLLTLLREGDARDHTRVAAGAAQLLEGWRARFGASRIESGTVLLEAVDAPSLREALALAPAIAARCRLIGPTCALVPADAANALTQALDARGFVV